MLTTDNDQIPERFKGVKLTKDKKPDTRTALGKEYQAWLDENAHIEGIKISDNPNATEEMNKIQAKIAANPENFAPEGQDAPNPSQPTQTMESAPVSEKTALETGWKEGDPVIQSTGEPLAGELPEPPKPGTHDAAKWLVERMVEFYPDLKRGDWTRIAVTLQLAQRHNQHWFKLKTAQQESQD